MPSGFRQTLSSVIGTRATNYQTPRSSRTSAPDPRDALQTPPSFARATAGASAALSVGELVPRSTGLSMRERLMSRALRSLPVKHGKHRLLDRLCPSAPVRHPQPVTITFEGKKLRIDVGDLIGWHFAVLKSFDPEVAEVLLAAASGEEVFWDIGANKGACSYAIAAALPDAKIVAIEPQALLRDDLIYNLEQLCPGRFEHHGVGISTDDGEAQLTIPVGNTGRGTLHPAQAGGTAETIRLMTAEHLVAASRFGWPSLVKVDVEGHELNVLSSMARVFESKRCKLVVFESHPSDRANFDAIHALAVQHGYEVLAIRKTPFTTRLVRTRYTVSGASDYVMTRPDVIAGSPALAALVDTN